LYFSLGMLGLVLWSFGAMLDYAVTSLSLKIFFSKLEAAGYLAAIPAFTRTSISIAGNDHWMKKKWLKVLFVGLPISNILLVWTNELHGWVWTEFIRQANNVVVFKHGIGFNWVVITTYPLLILVFINLSMSFRRGSSFMRRQTIWLMVALFFPVIANTIYHLGLGGVEGVDWTSITFSATGAIFLYVLYGMRFLDIIPIARDKLFNNLSDGMIVLDTQDRIIDINHVAANLFSQPVIGKNLAQVAPLSSAVLQRPLEEELKMDVSIGEAEKRFFDTSISPLFSEKKETIGRLLLFRDVTERKMAGVALEQQLAEIQKLHQELQETQELVLDQQRAFAKMEERRQIARDMHDSVNQSIHSLMLFSETLVALLEKDRTQEALNLARRIQESGGHALREIRLLIYRAQSILDEQDRDIIGSLEERLNMVERRVGISAKIIGWDEAAAHCPAAWNENLYWLVTEALNNSLKYSRARHITVTFTHAEKQLEVNIVDDGVGFDPEQIRAGGFGMRSMRERAELLGGTLWVISAVGSGVQVSFKAKTEK